MMLFGNLLWRARARACPKWQCYLLRACLIQSKFSRMNGDDFRLIDTRRIIIGGIHTTVVLSESNPRAAQGCKENFRNSSEYHWIP